MTASYLRRLPRNKINLLGLSAGLAAFAPLTTGRLALRAARASPVKAIKEE